MAKYTHPPITSPHSRGFRPFKYRGGKESGINEAQAYRLYHLIKGGVGQVRGTTHFPVKERHELLALAGVTEVVLSGAQLNDLFLEIDNRRKHPNSVPMPAGKEVFCNNCNAFIDTLPCQTCKANGSGENYVPKKRRPNPRPNP